MENGPNGSVIEIKCNCIGKAMDLETKAGKSRGLLHGIPILIKDNIDTGIKCKQQLVHWH
jgi:amidase